MTTHAQDLCNFKTAPLRLTFGVAIFLLAATSPCLGRQGADQQPSQCSECLNLGSEPMPLSVTGDKDSGRTITYPIWIDDGARVTATVLGDSKNIGQYDIAIYSQADDESKCLIRVLAIGVSSTRPQNPGRPPNQDSCETQQASEDKRTVEKGVFESKAQVSYLARASGKYSIVLEFRGPDVDVRLWVFTCKDCLDLVSTPMPMQLIGDRSIVPFETYPVMLRFGTHLRVIASGTATDAGKYEVTVYSPNGREPFNIEYAKMHKNLKAGGIAQAVESKKGVPSTSKAQADFEVPMTAKYFIVVEFYGSGVRINLSAQTNDINGISFANDRSH